ncbi:unnamed protein product [Moneuplotes crassus]|uniref:Peroxin-12 n=1 Tax=Euplotes crassus TaxID=5936 RepID=A0AAD2D2L4_EUPCR|nr:unnamed protein product [Moneuplotes crassus]
MELSGGAPKISFFEMVASDSLSSYFEGGFKYIYQVFTNHYDRLVPISYYSDEAYFIFDMLLQSYYLHKNSSSYAENFFSFTRSAVSFTNNRLKQYSTKHKVITLFFEVILPYLRLKVHKWYLSKKGDANFQYKKYLKIIPLTNGLYAFIDFLYKLKYLLQQDFKFFKPYLHLCNFLIRRKNMFELRTEEEKYSNKVVGVLSKYNVFIMFIFIKYCQWYFSQGNSGSQSSSQSQGEEICEPPPRAKPSKGCPLCQKSPIENPCALETSGYVFCFVCIQDYVEKNQRCPITGTRTFDSNIRKIYK